MNTGFWKNKKVLVTGHTGFKGSWLSLWLQTLGAEALGYSMPPASKPNLFDDARIAQGMTSVLGDIRDLEQLRQVISRHQPEIVMHLAAQSLVRNSYVDPIETYTTNVIGTANVLEAIRTARCVRSVIVVTSDKCYENREWMWGYRESDVLGGHDPYSSSKACAELVTASYRKSFFLSESTTPLRTAIASVRSGNVIGGGDWSTDRLIPDIIRAIQAGREVQIRNPHSVRPWQHVLEPLEGYLRLAEALYEHGGEYAEAWNFGPHDTDAVPVSDITKMISGIWSGRIRWQFDQSHQPHEAGYLRLDSAKARTRLNWSPKLALPEALRWTVEWYQSFLKGEDARKITTSQLSRYQGAAVA